MLAARTLSVFVLASLALAACQPKTEKTTPLTDADRKAITEGVARLDKAVLSGDARAATALYAEDAILEPPNTAEVRGRAGIQKFFEGFPKMSTFKQNVIEVEGHGDFAYARAWRCRAGTRKATQLGGPCFENQSPALRRSGTET
jgi:ketosteroid isomerase-like protein